MDNRVILFMAWYGKLKVRRSCNDTTLSSVVGPMAHNWSCKLIGILGHWNRAKNICSAYYVSVICRLPIATFSLTSKSLLRVMIRYNTPTFCSPLWKRYPSENLKIDILSLTQFFESSWQKSRRMELNPRWKIYLISLSTYWF